MFTLGIDADSIIYMACGITEKVVYDILPKDTKEELLDDHDDYKHLIIQTFRYVKEYNEWLKKNKKKKEDFLRVPRKESQPVSFTLNIINGVIKDTIKRFDPDQTIVYLSGDDNFREAEAFVKEYKGNRKDREKPKQFQECYDHIKNRWNAVIAKGEADDWVATLQTACLHEEDYSVIATNDKDLKTVPGWYYNYRLKELLWITPFEASKFFYTQLLVGDIGDNIPGCPGIGPKTAPKLLADCKNEYEMYKVCLKEYDKAYGNGKKTSLTVSGKMLQEQARLLWMERYRGDRWFPPENPNETD